MKAKQGKLNPWMLGAEIMRLQARDHELIDEFHKDGRYTSLRAEREVSKNLDEAKRLGVTLERELGRLRGWTVAKGCFTLKHLAENRRCPPEEQAFGDEFLDHPSFYLQNGLPAALVAQNYNTPERWEDISKHCKAAGLTCEVLDDFPSWHYPGHTTLILVTRPESVKEETAEGVDEPTAKSMPIENVGLSSIKAILLNTSRRFLHNCLEHLSGFRVESGKVCFIFARKDSLYADLLKAREQQETLHAVCALVYRDSPEVSVEVCEK